MTYKAWKDKANNIGIQCVHCGYTIWNTSQAEKDLLKRRPCNTCRELLNTGILATETQKHADEDSIEKCTHEISQP